MSELNENVEEPQDEAPDTPVLRQVSPEDLQRILEAHRKWVESKGKEGERADLSRANLQEANLRSANLQEANLRSANLQGANLQEAKLDHADLREANLSEADFRGAKLHHTKLREANLQDSNLTEVKSLLGGTLAGTDVTNAKLPADIAKFEALAHVEEISTNARTIFLAMLLGCVYSWLAIATTTHARLLTNSASSPLPVIQTEIPIVGFYWTAPLILFTFYAYFHLYLQRLWEGLAKLPAVFPDGRALHERAYPWLLNGLVRAHFRHLRTQRTLLSRLENAVSIALAWWVVPFTLLWFWVSYIPRHDWNGTAFHVALLVLSVGAAIMVHRHAVRTLRGLPTDFLWMRPWSDARTYQSVAALVIGAVLSGLSYGAIDGVRTKERVLFDPRTWVPPAFELIGYSAFAELREADVSTKPSDYSRIDDQERRDASVKGASLRGADLRYADAGRAFLINADLRDANLQGANLEGAQLQGANLEDAQLQAAKLGGANLQEANLRFAELQGAGLRGAKLQEANLSKANLQEADLEGAQLQGAKLGAASLQKANLQLANLQGADLGDANLQEADLVRARLQDASLYHANLQGANLGRANLQGAKLGAAKLQKANLLGANLQGAKLGAASLQKANLHLANLQEADLWRARLQEADLSEAQLQGAKLVQARLQGAKLRFANLQKADLRGANLQGANLGGANLQGADLQRAKGVTPSQVKTAKNWEEAFYSDDFLKELGLPPDHNERVKKKLAELEKEKKATGAKP